MMTYEYRQPDGQVDPKKLRAARKQVLADREMSQEDKAHWLSRFDSLERSRDSVFPSRMLAKRESTGDVVIDMMGAIGEDWFSMDGGITAKSIAKQIDGATGTIHVRMNSGGGDAFEGDAIGNLLAASPARVEVEILGLSASAASVIAMSGDEIRMAENAVMMIHDAWTMTGGGVKEHESAIQMLTAFNDGAAQIYARRSGKSADEMRDLMAKETWFTAQEAVDIGLADRVVPGKSISQAWDPSDLPAHIRDHLQISQRGKDFDMSAIALRLGLPESATEAEVLQVLDAKLAELKAQDEAPEESDTETSDDAAEAETAATAVAADAAKEMQAAAAELHQAACSAAVERLMADGKIPPAMRDQAIKACGKTAESLGAQCALWEQYPAIVTRKAAAVTAKVPTNKITTLTPFQKSLCKQTGVSQESYLAELNGDR